MTALSRDQEGRSTITAILRSCWDWVTGGSASELRCCGETEIERIAKDLQMSPAELRAVARQGPHAADLLLRRMAALDLDPAEVAEAGPQTFRDLQRTCSMCESKRRCARDLAHDSVADPAWKDYCPNAETLSALNVMPWASRREW